MKKNALITLLLLALCGFIISIILAKVGINVHTDSTYKSICNINETLNCDAVALSRYSEHFGIPNFLYGIIYYFIIFMLCNYTLFQKNIKFPNLLSYIFGTSFVSVIISIYLFMISHFVIHSFCIFCMIIYIVNILMFLVTFMAENWSISKHFNNLVTDSKMFFSSKIRTIAFIILSLVILTGLFYFNSHPLMGQTPTNSGSINMSNYDYSKTTSDRLVTGPDGVPEITILMFTDYECHFCGISSKEVKKLLVANPDIRLIFKDYPLDQSCNQRVGRPFHKFACEASISSRCAAEQGKFWEYHDLVFDNQNNLDPTSLQVYAEELKLNMDQFNSCVNNKKPLNKIITDIDEGAALGVSGTPTLFIEGKKIEGFRTFEELQKEIDTIKAEIQKQKEEYEKQKQEYLKQKAQQETQKNQAQNQNTNKQNNQE